jgi:TolB-like protein/class 3 adenylate cyclase/Flp pilus assembly protein TadD
MVQERPVRIERRLAAILAADVAGYTRLMHHDEEATHAKLTALLADGVEPAIAEYGGRIVKNTGDGFLAEFPSAVKAIRAALQFQTRVKDLTAADEESACIAFRVGINVGDVIVEPHDIFGDGVNIAARLESIAEPGGICISSSAFDHIRGKVGVEFADLGEQNLKNIDRPVRAYAVVRDGARSATQTGRAKPSPLSPPRLSIVVLPFSNLSGDPGQDYFVDGVTESLTTDLSRISGSFVIARNTAFTFKGKAVDVKQVGRELNVRYVLEGSVQRGSNRLRVNVQLVDAETGAHLWADRFDKPIADLFDMQDETVSRLANALDTQLVEAEAGRRERSLDPDAMDLYFKGRAWANRAPTRECMARARTFFELALVLDPEHVEALVGIAAIDAASAASHMVDHRGARFATAEAILTKVLSIAPQHAWAHLWLGNVKLFTKRATQGISECERALSLNRNLAEAYSSIGVAKVLIGRSEETEAHVREALRLSPRDNGVFRWLYIIGGAKLQLGADAEAVAWIRRCLETNRNYPVAHFHLGAALALLGELDEARAAVKDGLALDPYFTCRRFLAYPMSDNAVFLAAEKRIINGMRRAGVPEG